MNQSSYEEKSSTVCLDAEQVKRIREEQQLTQLYVSKVVGVTTDTISRWENNRYPTIRRENALKLAEALEVPLTELLLKPVEQSDEVLPSVQKKSPRTLIAIVVFALIGLLAVFIFLAETPPVPALMTAERILPVFAGPGSSIPVQVRLTPQAQSGGIIVREYFPKGWKVVQSHPPASSLDNVNGVVRWIIKAGDDRERIVYLVQVDSAVKLNSTATFRGEIVASRKGNQSAVPIEGGTSIAVASVHWADANGDERIDDGEMLEGSFTIEDMAGVHIDWNALEQLWDAGSYFWDERKGQFLPRSKEP